MNKTILFFVMLWVAAYVCADITSEIKVNQDNTVVRLAGENAVLKDNNRLCVTYCLKQGNEGVLELAISEDQGDSFSYYAIDTLYTQIPENPDLFLPQLKKYNNDLIYIVYNKLDDNGKIVLCKAAMSFFSDSITRSVIADSLTSPPILSKDENDFNVYYAYSTVENASDYCLFWDDHHLFYQGIGIMKLWGRDTFYGSIHSNTRFILQNSSNPVILGKTTAHEDIVMETGVHAPLDNAQIFYEGAQDFVKKKNLSGTADELRAIALTPFDSTADIVYVKINGSSYQSMYAYISETQIQVPVYSWYPADDIQARDIINNGGNWFEDANVIWTNNITKYDTTWVQGPAGIAENHQFWLESILWIEGTVSGKQTWGSAKDIYITSDILYTNTLQGDHPDGYNPSTGEYTNPVNSTDFCGLVSEDMIFVKYKHRDPFQNNLLRVDNCTDIDIYASLAAIGYGEPVAGTDIVLHSSAITFEYREPHIGLKDFSSISPYTQNDTTYTNVVYHRYILDDPANVPDSLQMYCLRDLPQYVYQYNDNTQATANPLYHNNYPNIPASTCPPMFAYDLPGYNPVGPEKYSDIVNERGHVNYYGAYVSRNTGFIHSSGSDPLRHQGAKWDLDNYILGSTTSSNGYSRDYLYDKRLLTNELPGFPKVYSLAYGGYSLIDDTELFEDNRTIESLARKCNGGYFASSDSIYALFFQRDFEDRTICEFDIYLSIDNGQNFDYRMVSLDTQGLTLKDIEISENEVYVLLYNTITENDVVYTYDKINNTFSEYAQIRSDFGVSDMAFFSNNSFIIAAPERETETRVAFYAENILPGASMYWNPFFIDDTSDNPITEIALHVSSTDDLLLGVQTNSISGWGDMYLGEGVYINTPTHEDINPVQEYSISNYPNPFNPETNIYYSIPEDAHVEILIYNIKGQRVKTLLNEKVSKGKYNIVWNGVDENNTPVASGVYFYNLRADNRTISVNKCVLIK